MYFKECDIFCEKVKFKAIECGFVNTKDEKIINELIEKANILADKVNPTLARDSGYTRTSKVKLKDCIGGVFAEYCWRMWLNSYFKDNKIRAKAKETTLQDTRNQIDIEVIYNSSDKKTIEVRSSFAYLGVYGAVCRNFKILGPYRNLIKQIEYTKDFHVMAVYSFHKDNLFNELKSEVFKVYLTGGATKNLLQTSPYASDEVLTPYDDISASVSKAIYRVIKPIVNGFDTIKISEEIAEYNAK